MLLAALLFPFGIFAQEEEVAPELTVAELELRCLNQLNNGVNVHLRYLSHAISLTDEEANRIREALSPILKNYARQSVADGFGSDDRFKGLPKGLELLLPLEIGNVLGKQRAKAIEEDTARKKTFYRRHRLNALLMRFDLALHLDEQQLDKLAGILDSQFPINVPYRGPLRADSLPRNVPAGLLKPILMPKQFTYFEIASKEPDVERKLFFPADDHKRLDWFKPELDAAFETHIAALKSEFELDDAQMRKLGLLKRQAMNRLLKIRSLGYKRRRAADSLFPGMELRIPSDSLGKSTASTLIALDEKWVRFVRGVLDDDDQDRFDRLQQRRQEMYHSHLAYYAVTFFDDYAKMDATQLENVYRLIRAKVPWNRAWLRDDFPIELHVVETLLPDIYELLEPNQRQPFGFWIQNSQRMLKQYNRLLEAAGLKPPEAPVR